MTFRLLVSLLTYLHSEFKRLSNSKTLLHIFVLRAYRQHKKRFDSTDINSSIVSKNIQIDRHNWKKLPLLKIQTGW